MDKRNSVSGHQSGSKLTSRHGDLQPAMLTRILDMGWSIYGYWFKLDGGTCIQHPVVYITDPLAALEFLGRHQYLEFTYGVKEMVTVPSVVNH